MAFDTPSPEKGARPRKVTDARGGHITPEGAKAVRMNTVKRGKYPKGSEPKPENTNWRKTGDPQSNPTPPDKRITPPAVGHMDGKSRTLENPVK